MSFPLGRLPNTVRRGRWACGFGHIGIAVVSSLAVVLATLHLALAGYDEALAAYKRGEYAKALPQFLLEAQGGNPRAQNIIGRMYDEGQGVPEDDSVAVHWYRLAAEQGFASSQFNLGLMYLEGTGVETDAAAALSWLRKAAEQGHARAQNRVGQFYDGGLGVAEDDTVAVEWYRKAAEQGQVNAQYNLGLMYEAGTGVSQDYDQALRWMREAAAQDHKKAKERLPGIEAQLAKTDGEDAADASDDERSATTGAPRRYDPKSLAEKIEQLHLETFDVYEEHTLPEAFGFIVALAGDKFHTAEPGTAMPGYYGRAEFVSAHFNSLTYFLFDAPAAALEGFDRFVRAYDDDEPSPVARRDVWDEKAGRNILMFCTHPALSETAPPDALECMLHDPHTQVVIGAEVQETLKSAEQREKVRNTALGAIVTGLTVYRDGVLPAANSQASEPATDRQDAAKDNRASASDPEAGRRFNALVSELDTLSRGVAYGTYHGQLEEKRFFRGKSVRSEPDGALRVALSVCLRNSPDAKVSDCGTDLDWGESAWAGSVGVASLDRIDPQRIYTQALDPSGKALPALRLDPALDAVRFHESNSFALIAHCESGDTCVHYEAVGGGDRLYIPCPGQTGCSRMESILGSLVETASAASFDSIVTALKADSFPTSSIEEMGDARRTARRIGKRFSNGTFSYHLTGFDYLLQQLDADLIDERTLAISNKACLPDECETDSSTTWIELDHIDAKTAAVVSSDDGMRYLHFQCKVGTDCMSTKIGGVLDSGLDQWILTCKDSAACDDSLQDLLSLAAFASSRGGAVANAANDIGLVGVWAAESFFLNEWVTEFRADGTFVFTNASSATEGFYETNDGVLIQEIPATKFRDEGPYRFLDDDTLEITGKYGANIWKRRKGGG